MQKGGLEFRSQSGVDYKICTRPLRNPWIPHATFDLTLEQMISHTTFGSVSLKAALHCKPLQLDYIFATTQKLQGTAGCCAWEFAAQFTASKCNLNIFFNCRELPVVKSTAGQQVYYIQKMYPTVNCQKYSQSTAEKGTRLKAVFLTTRGLQCSRGQNQSVGRALNQLLLLNNH